MSLDFDADLDVAARLAALAPSSHNCQPWALAHLESREAREQAAALLGATDASGEGDPARSRWIVLALDRARALRALPAYRIEMHVSCGMYLHVLLEALATKGWRPRLAWSAGGAPLPLVPRWPAAWDPLAAVELRPAAPRGDTGQLAALLRARITNRAPYRPEAIAAQVLDGLRSPRSRIDFGAADAPLPPTFLASPDEIAAVGRFVSRTAGVDFSHPAAWAETYAYIRFGDREIREAQDGFPVTQLAGPMTRGKRLLSRIALAPGAMRLLSRFGHADRLGRALGAVVAATPALAAFALASETPSVAAQLAGGGGAMDFWLRATAAGLVLHPVSVVLQHPELRAAFQRERGMAGRVFFLARVGQPATAFPPAPRRRDPLAAVSRV